MTLDLLIDRATVVLEGRLWPEAAVEIAAGRIVRIRPAGRPADLPDERYFDAAGAFLAPGFIDLHIHGVHNHLVDNGPEEVAAIAAILPQYGVTGFLPTVCLLPAGEDVVQLQQLTRGAAGPGAGVLGFHLEGPFLKLTGAIAPEALGAPDPKRVEALIAAAAPWPVIFSISPEMPEIESLIAIMAHSGAPVFMTHTQASVAETQRAIAAGACHATHFYDVFPVPPVTEGGVRPCGTVEAILAAPNVSVDFILDGVHVDPVALQMALQCKGPDRVCLITDAMVGTGLPPGRFVFGGREVEFAAPGLPARLVGCVNRPGGGLAGSGLTMNLAVRNAVELAGLELPLAVRLASANPAQVLRRNHRKGSIKPGFDADLTLFDQNYQIRHTWVAGKSVYQGTEQ